MKSKFKVGDLVMLSAAGKRSQQNEDFIGGFGFIENIVTDKSDRYWAYPIRCKWWKENLDIVNASFKPYELKFFKNK
jgi:uncharacterized protein YodC (DUF2158 family)